jgi:hypothetical protein
MTGPTFSLSLFNRNAKMSRAIALYAPVPPDPPRPKKLVAPGCLILLVCGPLTLIMGVTMVWILLQHKQWFMSLVVAFCFLGFGGWLVKVGIYLAIDPIWDQYEKDLEVALHEAHLSAHTDTTPVDIFRVTIKDDEKERYVELGGDSDSHAGYLVIYRCNDYQDGPAERTAEAIFLPEQVRFVEVPGEDHYSALFPDAEYVHESGWPGHRPGYRLRIGPSVILHCPKSSGFIPKIS